MHHPCKGRSFLAGFLLVLLSLSSLVTAQESAMSTFVDGVEAYESADYEEALGFFERAIDLEPSNLEFRYYLGLTYGAMKRHEQALAVFESIVEKEPDHYRKAYFEIASIYSKQGKYQKAIETLTLIEKIDPKAPRIYLEKGYAYQKLKNYDQAIESFNKAKDVDPKMAQLVYYNIGAAYFEAEQFDKAKEMFTKAIAVDSSTPIAENARRSIPNVNAAKKVRKPWNVSASFAYGYDSNVLAQPLQQVGVDPITGIALNRSDEFMTFTFSGGFRFLNRKDLQIGAGYSLFATGYEDLRRNNVLAHIPYAYLQYSRRPVSFRIQYDYSTYRTGGDEDGQDLGLFLNLGSGSEERLRMHSVMPTIGIVEPHGLRTDIILTYQNKDFLDVTPDSSLYLGEVTQSWNVPRTDVYLRLGYRHIYEDAEDEIASYRYHGALFGVAFPLFWGIRGDAFIGYARVNFQGSLGRRDSRYAGAATLSRFVTSWLQLLASYNYAHNNSNTDLDGIDPFNFEKNVVSITITGLF